MARELMAITGLSAQELVHLARSAFGAASACLSAARAAQLGIFLSDRITGDALRLCLIGGPPPSAYICVQLYIRLRIGIHIHTNTCM